MTRTTARTISIAAIALAALVGAGALFTTPAGTSDAYPKHLECGDLGRGNFLLFVTDDPLYDVYTPLDGDWMRYTLRGEDASEVLYEGRIDRANIAVRGLRPGRYTLRFDTHIPGTDGYPDIDESLDLISCTVRQGDPSPGAWHWDVALGGLMPELPPEPPAPEPTATSEPNPGAPGVTGARPTVRVRIACHASPERTTISNRTGSGIRIVAIRSLRPARSPQTFARARRLPSGETITFESGRRADRDVLSRRDLYGHVRGEKVQVLYRTPFGMRVASDACED